MAKMAYILYEGDQWITYRNLIPMGVFDSEESLLEAAKTLLEQQIEYGFHDIDGDKEAYIDNALDEIKNNRQFRGQCASIYVKTVEMNKLEEF